MNNLYPQLLKEMNLLNNQITQIEKRISSSPMGSLRVSKDRNHIRYYQRVAGEEHYLTKEKEPLAQALAQKKYDATVLSCAKARKKQIEKLLSLYQDENYEELLASESTDRKKLIHPVYPTWEQQLIEWKSNTDAIKNTAYELPDLFSEAGTQVRSKSEKMMADYFEKVGLPYKYEYPLQLHGCGTLFPDFTFLSQATRQEVYWEHFGMMDHPAYADKAVKKINTYAHFGIIPGRNLIVTFESSTIPIQMDQVKLLTEHYLLPPAEKSE